MKRKPMKNGLLIPAFALACALAVGCGETDKPAGDGAPGGGATALLPEGLFLASAPEGAKPITALKQSAKQGDEVVVRVVVGGRVEPLVEGRASAAIIDAGVANQCLGEDDHCKTPWDYCCTLPEDVTANLATLQVINQDGKVLASGLGPDIKPLATLVVRGVVGPRPDSQVLTINATGIYVEKAGR